MSDEVLQKRIGIMKDRLTNKDLFDFKQFLVGTGYGTVEPFLEVFGLSRSVYYKLLNSPSEPLQPWHACSLRVYKALTYDELVRVLKVAHGIDLREAKR